MKRGSDLLSFILLPSNGMWSDENELTLGDSLSRKIDEGLPGQAHPVPSIDTNVNPEGAVSVTFTIPLVGTEPTGLDTTAV
jgi:hypothetical protein